MDKLRHLLLSKLIQIILLTLVKSLQFTLILPISQPFLVVPYPLDVPLNRYMFAVAECCCFQHIVHGYILKHSWFLAKWKEQKYT